MWIWTRSLQGIPAHPTSAASSLQAPIPPVETHAFRSPRVWWPDPVCLGWILAGTGCFCMVSIGYRDNLIQQVMWKTVIIRSISFTYFLVNLIFWGNFLLRACYTPPLVSIELRSQFAFLLSWWNFIGSTSPNRELFRLPVWYPPQNEQQTPPENGPKAKRMFRYSIPTIPFPETKVLVSGSVMTIKVWIIGVLPPVFI